MSLYPSSKNNKNFGDDIVTLTDEVGRTLQCRVEYSMEVEGQEYVLLLPVDTPVEILTWDEDDEDEAATPVESESEIDKIFDTAKAVLAEQNLTLHRTAVTLTAEGELPDFPDEELDRIQGNNEEDDDYEELLWLCSFYYEEQEYGIYTPLDPFFILARMNAKGQPELLSVEEFQKLEPMLPMIEDQLFDDME